LSILEYNSTAGAILQASLLTVLSIFCIHNGVAGVKVRNVGKGQQLMVLHFLTRDWGQWCATEIWLPRIDWLEVA
jgi:hypothetical protein